MPIWAIIIVVLLVTLILLVSASLFFEIFHHNQSMKVVLDPGPNRYERRAAKIKTKRVRKNPLTIEVDSALEFEDVRMVVNNLRLAEYPGRVYWRSKLVYVPPSPPQPIIPPPPPGPGSSVPPRGQGGHSSKSKLIQPRKAPAGPPSAPRSNAPPNRE